jgi:hypothetical protein
MEDGVIIGKYGRPLKPRSVGDYHTVALTLEDGIKEFYVHRLVAAKFIPNPRGKAEVNHKDTCGTNNHVDNLEWATRKENVLHTATYCKRLIPIFARKGSVILVFESQTAAAHKLGLPQPNIGKVLKGRRKTCGGWAFGFM